MMCTLAHQPPVIAFGRPPSFCTPRNLVWAGFEPLTPRTRRRHTDDSCPSRSASPIMTQHSQSTHSLTPSPTWPRVVPDLSPRSTPSPTSSPVAPDLPPLMTQSLDSSSLTLLSLTPTFGLGGHRCCSSSDSLPSTSDSDSLDSDSLDSDLLNVRRTADPGDLNDCETDETARDDDCLSSDSSGHYSISCPGYTVVHDDSFALESAHAHHTIYCIPVCVVRLAAVWITIKMRVERVEGAELHQEQQLMPRKHHQKHQKHRQKQKPQELDLEPLLLLPPRRQQQRRRSIHVPPVTFLEEFEGVRDPSV